MVTGSAVRTDRCGPVRVGFVGRSAGTQVLSDADGTPSSLETAKRALAELGVSESKAVVNRQVHSCRVVPVEDAPSDADGLFVRGASGSKGKALCVFTADCVPVLVADPDRLAFAALHAGWRGLASGIIGAGVELLAHRTRRSGLTAWIGPSIGACCYQVSAEVAVSVAERSGAGVVVAPAIASRMPIRVSGIGVEAVQGEVRPHLDLVSAASAQLERIGVEDIRRLDTCTHCDPRWHSYRRDGAGAGRNHGLIWTEVP